MKHCKYCGKFYNESDFGIALTTKNKVYRRQKCRFCYHQTKKKLHKKYKQWILEKKGETGCQKCGFKDVRALEFHHTANNKEFGIADQGYFNYGFERLEKEINKCMVLCANCHRILHVEKNKQEVDN